MNHLAIGGGAERLEIARGHGPAKARGRLVRGWIRLLHAVRRQRQRAALAQLDERLLQDIGVSREQARAEADKPIWRD